MEKTFKIGIVGFSRNQFNKQEAAKKLEQMLLKVIENRPIEEVALVSGYTSSGVPKLAYILADRLGLHTVGFSSKRALTVKSGVYPVSEVILIGEKFGDESQAFVEYINVLIRIGGGPQSRHEVELFKHLHKDKNLEYILFEEEVEWYGQ
jgi:hypothetical protein